MIQVNSYIHCFYNFFLYNGFIIENFNQSGKNPVERVLLNIKFNGELVNKSSCLVLHQIHICFLIQEI